MLLWAMLLAGCGLVGLFSLFTAMITDGCGSDSTDGVCGNAGATAYVTALITFWVVITASLVGSFLLALRSHRRGDGIAWIWPLGGAVVVALAVLVFWGVLGALTS